MKFNDFIKKGMVRKASKDVALSRSLVKNAKKDLIFLRGLEVNENSARKVMVGYYDVLRSVLEAISALEGYKVYSHEAFSYFLRERNEENLAIKFDRFRKIRNSINYYGEDISFLDVKEIVIGIEKDIDYLTDRYLGEI